MKEAERAITKAVFRSKAKWETKLCCPICGHIYRERQIVIGPPGDIQFHADCYLRMVGLHKKTC